MNKFSDFIHYLIWSVFQISSVTNQNWPQLMMRCRYGNFDCKLCSLHFELLIRFFLLEELYFLWYTKLSKSFFNDFFFILLHKIFDTINIRIKNFYSIFIRIQIEFTVIEMLNVIDTWAKCGSKVQDWLVNVICFKLPMEHCFPLKPFPYQVIALNTQNCYWRRSVFV